MTRKKLKITEEDFASWKDSTITQMVVASLDDLAGALTQKWASFLSGEVPLEPKVMQFLHVELKAKLEMIEDFKTLELGAIQSDDDSNVAKFPGKTRKAQG